MSIDVKLAKQAIQDKLESQMNTAEAKLNTLKAHAQPRRLTSSSKQSQSS